MARAQQRDEFEFGAFDEDYRGFDPYEEDGGRGPLILFLAVAVILIFAGVVWNTYRQGVRDEGRALPLIAAADTPYKRAPDDPGGVETPDLNRRIYDQMDGSKREDLMISSALRSEPTVEQVLQGGPPLELRPGLGRRGGDAPAEDSDDTPTAKIERPAPIEIAPARPAPVVRVEPQPAPEPERRSRFAFDSAGGFLVQIAALRSEAAAEDAWGRAVKASPLLYAGAERRIQRADLGARGVFYRLRAGAFADRGAAATFCDAVKAEGGDCIVVEK